MTDDMPSEALARERYELLRQVERALNAPMVVLGFVWLGLLIWELLNELSPMLEAIGLVIWILFIVEFGIEFVLAPRNWRT